MSLTSTQTPLARLNDILTMLDYGTQLLPVSKENGFEQLLVALDREVPADGEARYVMQLFFAEDVMRASGIPEMQEGSENSATLQFMLELPVACANLNPARLLETYEALNLFTQTMPLGNLGLNQDRNVYFRYAHTAEDKNMNASRIAELIGMFGFFLTQFGPLLNDFVTNNQDVMTLMQEAGFHNVMADLKS